MTRRPGRLFRMLESRGFSPAHVAEVGVYRPETSNVYEYVARGVRATLVEPDPDSIAAIREHFAGRENVTLHPVAVFDRNGRIELVRRAASTFVAELPSSPAIVNDGYRIDDADKFAVEARTFDSIDDGTIDLLSVDVEGSEWYVIERLVSRPAVISLETHGAAYRNPRIHEISSWMRGNGYRLWYLGKADSVYVREGVIEPSAGDRVRLILWSAYLRWRRLSRRVRRTLRRSPRA